MCFRVVFWLYGLKPMSMELFSSTILITFSFAVRPQVLHRLAAVRVQKVALSGAGEASGRQRTGSIWLFMVCGVERNRNSVYIPLHKPL